MNNFSTKYIFVTGGVTSSLGKGIIAASLGKLLISRGYKVTIQKLDPYINIDPGTMNPYEHGECYVTNDGAETWSCIYIWTYMVWQYLIKITYVLKHLS